jgi:iron complex outermembrane receptor protein
MSIIRLLDSATLSLPRVVSKTMKIGLLSTAAFGTCLSASAQENANSTPSKELPPVTVQNASKPPATTKRKPKGEKKIEGPTASKANVATETSIAADIQFVPVEGTVVDGYRVSNISDVGPLGERPLLTTPYSVSVISQDLIKNTQATSTDDLFRLNPFIHNMWPVARGNPLTTVMRGFTTTTSYLDNMRLENAQVIFPEGLDRVEVLTGLSGFLYGPASPGGTINYVLKTPTRTPFADVKGGLVNDSGYVTVDLGGPLAPGANTFYRITGVHQDGGTAVDGQNVERNYVAGAFDFKIADNALLQLKGFHGDYRADGPDPFWIVSSTALYPSAPNAGKLWGQKWGYVDNEQNGGNAKLKWDINKFVSVRAGYTYISASNEAVIINNTISNNSGTYSQSALANAAGTLTTQSGYAIADARFETGDLAHTVSAGYSAGSYKSALPLDPTASFSLGSGFSLTSPTYVAPHSFNIGTKPESTYFTRGENNIFISDSIDWGRYWSAIVGVNYATIDTTNYTYIPAAGQPRSKTAEYNESKLTPTGSIIFKPTEWSSIYASYMQGLEQGGTAPTNAANDPGKSLPPYLSEQYEIGAKLQLGGALLTFAAFDITKAYAYLDPDTLIYRAAGRQHNQGIELGITGKVSRDLTLYGGFSAIRARIEDDPTLKGKRPVDVPAEIFKLYTEYNIREIPGLTLTGGINYASDFAAFADNHQFLPDVWTGDIGLRYETVIGNTPFITRLDVTNVTDESYWMSSRFIGAPRAIMLTGETRF